MASQQAAARCNLIDEIKEKISLNRGVLSEFDVMRFKKKAVALKSVEPDNAYAALGILECVTMNVQKCIEFHERSVACSRYPSIALQNYANSMRFVGRFSDAANISVRAWTVDPANLSALNIAIESFFELGDEKNFLDYASRWEKIAGEEHDFMQKYREEVDEANNLSVDCMLISLPAFKEMQ